MLFFVIKYVILIMVKVMNIYDFDETIYDGNSSLDFFLFSLRKKPCLVLKTIFSSMGSLFKFVIRMNNTKQVKEKIFSYIKHIDNFDEYLNEFVDIYKKKIKSYYLIQQKESDVIISASFDIWIDALCKEIGIKHVIATTYDIKKCKIIGENNHDYEKIRRFRKEYPNAKVKCAYSDSLHDIPMFEIAEEAFLVKKNNLIRYEGRK